ncbi:MAG: DUF1289 domain-containing protein [Pseudomonadota bacterium]
MKHYPSPCLDVCKYKIRGVYCIACGMTKPQKRLFEGMFSEDAQRAFLEELKQQQARVGSAKTWSMEYAAMCKRQGVQSPFETSED